MTRSFSLILQPFTFLSFILHECHWHVHVTIPVCKTSGASMWKMSCNKAKNSKYNDTILWSAYDGIGLHLLRCPSLSFASLALQHASLFPCFMVDSKWAAAAIAWTIDRKLTRKSWIWLWCPCYDLGVFYLYVSRGPNLKIPTDYSIYSITTSSLRHLPNCWFNFNQYPSVSSPIYNPQLTSVSQKISCVAFCFTVSFFNSATRRSNSSWSMLKCSWSNQPTFNL